MVGPDEGERASDEHAADEAGDRGDGRQRRDVADHQIARRGGLRLDDRPLGVWFQANRFDALDHRHDSLLGGDGSVTLSLVQCSAGTNATTAEGSQRQIALV